MVRWSCVRKLRFNDVCFWFVIVRYFALLNSYVTLGLQKYVFLIKSDIRQFLCVLAMREIMSQLRCVLICQFTVSYPTSELCCKCFSYKDISFMMLGLHSFVVRMEMTWQLRFVFVRHCDLFFITSRLRYSFVRCRYAFWWRRK